MKMRVVSDINVKIVGLRPYKFRDDQNQKEVVGTTCYYIEPPTEEDLQRGFIGDKCGVCNIPGSRSDLKLGVLAKLVFDQTMWKGEYKVRVVDMRVLPTR